MTNKVILIQPEATRGRAGMTVLYVCLCRAGHMQLMLQKDMQLHAHKHLKTKRIIAVTKSDFYYTIAMTKAIHHNNSIALSIRYLEKKQCYHSNCSLFIVCFVSVFAMNYMQNMSVL